MVVPAVKTRSESGWAEAVERFQVPSSKSQTSAKSQTPKRRPGSREPSAWILFEVWNLELGTFISSVINEVINAAGGQDAFDGHACAAADAKRTGADAAAN